MDEMYAMLGREHQSHLAAVAGPRPVLPDRRRSKRRWMLVLLRLRQA